MSRTRCSSRLAIASGFALFEIAQVRYYNDDQRLGAFEVGAPTNHVLELSGQEPEDFETITCRYVATRPEAVRSWGNNLRALAFMARMMLTRARDTDKWERERAIIRSWLTRCRRRKTTNGWLLPVSKSSPFWKGRQGLKFMRNAAWFTHSSVEPQFWSA